MTLVNSENSLANLFGRNSWSFCWEPAEQPILWLPWKRWTFGALQDNNFDFSLSSTDSLWVTLNICSTFVSGCLNTDLTSWRTLTPSKLLSKVCRNSFLTRCASYCTSPDVFESSNFSCNSVHPSTKSAGATGVSFGICVATVTFAHKSGVLFSL